MNTLANNKNDILFEEERQNDSMENDNIKHVKDIYNADNVAETIMISVFDTDSNEAV